MGLHYHQRRGRLVPDYVCQQQTLQQGHAPCQRIPGAAVDAAIGELLVRRMTPLAVDVALAVQAELATRAEEARRLRQQQVEAARYEAELAQRRFLRVDPDNRLVADVLEAEWNAKLRALAAAQEEVERQRQQDEQAVSEQQQAAVRALTLDFPRLWTDPRTADRERKRMVRLLVEDVTLHKEEQIVLQVRFKGGATETLRLAVPQPATGLRRTDPAIVATIDRLLDEATDGEIAVRLNAEGQRSCDGKPFTAQLIGGIRQRHHLVDRFTRLRTRGLLTVAELTVLLGVGHDTVERWRERGLVRGESYNDKGQWLYYPPGDQAPVKGKHKPSRSQVAPEAGQGGAV